MESSTTTTWGCHYANEGEQRVGYFFLHLFYNVLFEFEICV